MFLFKSLAIRAYQLASVLVVLWCAYGLLHGQWQWLSPLLVWSALWVLNGVRYYWRNVYYRDERETPALLVVMLAMAGMLLAGQKDWPLWLSLAGLFALLLHNVVLTSVRASLREQDQDLGKDDLELTSMTFVDATFAAHSAERKCDREVRVGEQQWLLFVHSGYSVYTRMQVRDLLAKVTSLGLKQPPVLVFAGEVPQWAIQWCRESSVEVRCWSDPQARNSERLGLWMRGGHYGSGLFCRIGENSKSGESSEYLAQRPALAIVSQGQVRRWQVAQNYRCPPSVDDNLSRLQKWLT